MIMAKIFKVSLVSQLKRLYTNNTDIECVTIDSQFDSTLKSSHSLWGSAMGALIFYLNGQDSFQFAVSNNTISEIYTPEIQLEFPLTITELKNLFSTIEKTSPQKRILKITKLGFVSADINDQGASVCAEFLRKDPLMTHFNLENNKITMKGAKELAAIFEVNTTLVSLNLKGNLVESYPEGKVVLEAIEKGCKRNQMFAEQKYAPLHIAAYMDDDKKIKELFITPSGLTPLEIAQKKSHFKSVELLLGSKEQNNNSLSKSDFFPPKTHLSDSKKVPVIEIKSLGDAESIMSQENEIIDCINWRFNIVVLRVLKSLFQINRGVKGIQFYISLGNVGLKILFEALAENHAKVATGRCIRIENIGFNEANINDEGVLACAEFLKLYPNFTHFDLANNQISLLSGIQALADILKSNVNIISMKLEGNPIANDPKGKEVVKLIQHYCARNRMFVEEKYTPLHIAAYMGNFEQVIQLLSAQSKFSPLEIAKQQDHQNIITLLTDPNTLKLEQQYKTILHENFLQKKQLGDQQKQLNEQQQYIQTKGDENKLQKQQLQEIQQHVLNLKEKVEESHASIEVKETQVKLQKDELQKLQTKGKETQELQNQLQDDKKQLIAKNREMASQLSQVERTNSSLMQQLAKLQSQLENQNKEQSNLIKQHTQQLQIVIDEKQVLEQRLKEAQEQQDPNYLLLKGAQTGNQRLLQVALAQSPSNINFAKPDGITGLHWAAINDDKETAEFFLSCHAKIEAANQLGETPLYLACKNHKRNIADFLLLHGANLEATNNQSDTVFYSICQQGDLEWIEYLIMKGAKLYDGKELHVNPLEKKQFVLDTILFRAAKVGDEVLAKQAIKQGANINAKAADSSYTPLHNAVSGGHLNIVSYLLELSADVNLPDFNKETPYDYVKEYTTSDVTRFAIKLLLLNQKLLLAVMNGDLKAVKETLALKADVRKAVTNTGETVLHIAAKQGHLEIAQELIKNGADLEAKDNKQQIPLHAAVLGKDENNALLIVTLLVRKHGELDAKKDKEQRQKAKNERTGSIHTADVDKNTPDELATKLDRKSLAKQIIIKYTEAKLRAKQYQQQNKFLTEGGQQFGTNNNNNVDAIEAENHAGDGKTLAPQ